MDPRWWQTTPSPGTNWIAEFRDGALAEHTMRLGIEDGIGCYPDKLPTRRADKGDHP